MPVRIKLREIARQKGLGQSRLSRLANMDIHMIQRIYKNPYANTTLATLERLAIALDVDICDLIVLERTGNQIVEGNIEERSIEEEDV